MEFSLTTRTLHFKIPARTSRGAYTEHRMVIVTLKDGGRSGMGECAPLPDLSCDRDCYGDLGEVKDLVAEALGSPYGARSVLQGHPALLFALESALAELNRDPCMYGTAFSRGKEGIPINGLVWMSDKEDMLKQAQAKIAEGYRCIKFKIGAIRWEDELSLLKHIRSRFTPEELQLRVDANGAFSPEEAPRRLHELSQFGLHSIEQPIRQGQRAALSELCRTSPVPIALDEELIGVNSPDGRRDLLEEVRPQYIVVKPTLHGGLSGAREWIGEAGRLGIGSWITSALESNIGLKSVSLLAASLYGSGPFTPAQGLGTGQLFTDNINNGIRIRNGSVWLSE